jgi:hypothetical protein
MAKDRAQFNHALERWDDLKERGNLSLPADVGRMAIFCVYSYDYLPGIEDDNNKYITEETTGFINEAHELAAMYKQQGKDVKIFGDANTEDFVSVLRNSRFSDIITIGHGNLDSFFLPDEEGNDASINWTNVSRVATHLKTGKFIQRHCGGFGTRLSVPLGTFAMSRHCDVIAPVGQGFTPESLDDPVNDYLTATTDKVRLEYKDARALFRSQRHEEKDKD